MLTVYIDFKSPAAYLAMQPTLSLADRLGLTVDWRPFRAIERDVPKIDGAETVGERHRRVRAASQRALAVKYAAHQGIDLRFPETPGSTDLALGAMLGIEGDETAFLQAAFAAYWTDHEVLDDEATVARILAETGTDYRGHLSEAPAHLDLAQAKSEEAGIVGTPAYVIEEQIFVGREHLPWIEEIARAAA